MPIGRTELGDMIYRTVLGNVYYADPTGGPRPQAPIPPLTTTLDAEGRAIHDRQPEANLARRVSDALLGLGAEAVRGLAAPGQALRGEPVTLGDAWTTAVDWGLMGAPVGAPEGALRAGGLGAAADAAETPAQKIARLLREGRAADVTDDMMAAADDMELWRLYESGATGQAMPMDEASRMARAGEMGFEVDAPLYHGTSTDAAENIKMSGFNGRVFGTPSEDVALDYAENAAAFGGDPDVVQFVARPKSGGIDYDLPGGETIPFGQGEPEFTDAWRRGISMGFDPTGVRSVSARFDPRLKHLANLSAGVGGVGLMSVFDQEEDPKAQIARYLAERGM